MLTALTRWLRPADRRQPSAPPRGGLGVTRLEDRSTPASFAGNVITLDDAGETLTIFTSVSGQYTLTSTADVNGTAGPATFTPTGPVTVVDSAAGTGVLFANSGDFNFGTSYAHSFDVTLDDGSAGVRFDGASYFGANNLSVTTDRGIAINPIASVDTLSGNITLSANRQATATAGEFIGVDVQGRVYSVWGAVNVRGRGGLGGGYGLYGVFVLSGTIRSSNGAVTVDGLGGDGAGAGHVGVHVATGGVIETTMSSLAPLTVSGTGGAGTGQGHYGVLIQGSNSYLKTYSSQISVTGTAGANGTRDFGVGVYVTAGGGITASEGESQVSLTGTGGGTGSSAHNFGVYVAGSGSRVLSFKQNVRVLGTGGGGTGGGSAGVHVASGGWVDSLGTTTITGTGGAGTGQGNFGVLLQGPSTKISSGAGGTVIAGVAGANSPEYGVGVYVYDGALVMSDGTGTDGNIGAVSVTGTGGGGANTTNAAHNNGVFVVGEGSVVTSAGGNVTVTGTGGSGWGTVSVFNSSGDSSGVHVAGGGVISSGTGGVTTVTGTGGSGTGICNYGVMVQGENTLITSGGGGTAVVGKAAANSTSAGSVGVCLYSLFVGETSAPKITSGGTGAVSVTGTGAGPGDGILMNYGVYVRFAQITSGGGPISVQGESPTKSGVALSVGGAVASTANAAVTVTADAMEVEQNRSFEGTVITGSVSAGTGTVTLRPLTAGTMIQLGTTSWRTPLGAILGLTDAELDLVTAGTLVIGSATAGSIDLVDGITRPAPTAVQLVTGRDVTTTGKRGALNTGGGPVALTVGTSVYVSHGSNVTSFTASAVTFSAGTDLNFTVTGSLADQYSQLLVDGAVTLTGADLVLRMPYGSPPVPGDVFTLVSATSVTGAFNGLPDGATVTLNGATLRINYTATAATATTL